MAAKAERRRKSYTYHNKNKNWNFERYFTVQKDQPQIFYNLE